MTDPAAQKRSEIRRACKEAGTEVSGLHWLLAAPAAAPSPADILRRSRILVVDEAFGDVGGLVVDMRKI